MKQIVSGLFLALLISPAVLHSQSSPLEFKSFSELMNPESDPDPMGEGGGGGGGGQVVESAVRGETLTKFTVRSGLSPLGTGGQIATNLSHKLDVRAFGNYTNFNYNFVQSGFNIGLNIGFANAGAFVDYYPFHKSFRISPGYLFYNTNRVRADVHAQPNATFTINNIDWRSDPLDPVHGTGRVTLDGSGFLITGGYGHIVSRKHKHFSFPFEAGAAFINTPKTNFYLNGKICSMQGLHCQQAINYPGFATALRTQIKTWDNRVQPFHIYPLIEGGIAYTFRIRH